MSCEICPHCGAAGWIREGERRVGIQRRKNEALSQKLLSPGITRSWRELHDANPLDRVDAPEIRERHS
jgi:hypothetical protein